MDDQVLAAAINAQYSRVLTCLRKTVETCPDELWDACDGTEAPFWQQAMHVVFYAHLYLCASDSAPEAIANAESAMRELGAPMKDWSGAEVGRLGNTLGGLMHVGFRTPRMVTRPEIIERLNKADLALQGAIERLAKGGATLSHPMSWMEGSALDLLLYNLRHVQHHVGRLHSLLGRRGKLRLHWH